MNERKKKEEKIKKIQPTTTQKTGCIDIQEGKNICH